MEMNCRTSYFNFKLSDINLNEITMGFSLINIQSIKIGTELICTEIYL